MVGVGKEPGLQLLLLEKDLRHDVGMAWGDPWVDRAQSGGRSRDWLGESILQPTLPSILVLLCCCLLK